MNENERMNDALCNEIMADTSNGCVFFLLFFLRIFSFYHGNEYWLRDKLIDLIAAVGDQNERMNGLYEKRSKWMRQKKRESDERCGILFFFVEFRLQLPPNANVFSMQKSVSF